MRPVEPPLSSSKRQKSDKPSRLSSKPPPGGTRASSAVRPPSQRKTPRHVSRRDAAAAFEPETPAGPFKPGDVLDGVYRILGEIGTGGYGVVYEAQDEHLGRRVALKVSTQANAELGAEAEATSAFHHPGVTRIYGSGSFQGHSYIVMEVLRGQTLWDYVQSKGRFGKTVPVLEAVELLGTVAQTLAVVHAAGLVHRDVKPGNVMIVPDGRIVLMDFGLFLPRAGVELHPEGTAEYMAPETIRGIPACPSADIYSLGVTAYEMLTGEVPFSRIDVLAMVHRQREPKIEPLRNSRPDVPAVLADLIHEMLDQDPNARPDAGAVVYRMGRVKHGILDRMANGFQVMVVDDDPTVNRLLTMWIGARLPEAKVRNFFDADQALASIRQAQPDVLLLDLNMPNVSGVELCMVMRGMNLARDCMIVAVSAAAQTYDQMLLRTLGVSRFVPKGATMLHDVLVHVVKQWELVQKTTTGA